VAALCLTKEERRFFSVLLRRKVPFMIVGLSAAAMQGAPVVTQDIELWFQDLNNPSLAQALRDVGAAYVPPSILNPPMFALAGTDLFDIVLRMDGLRDFKEELAHCHKIPFGPYSLRVLSLERILASKRAANRPKDKLVVPVLEDSLATILLKTSSRKKRVRKRWQTRD
jgi:hypothetical protein